MDKKRLKEIADDQGIELTRAIVVFASTIFDEGYTAGQTMTKRLLRLQLGLAVESD